MRSPTRANPWAVPLALCLAVAGSRAAADDRPVVVSLRASALVTGAQVCVRDVAALSGGSAAQRERIGRLDLADAPRRGQAMPLVKELIAYRIQVAGVGRDHFRLEGASHVLVSQAGGPLTEDDFVEAARQALLEVLPYRPEDVSAAAVQAVPLPQAEVGPKDEVRLDAVPRPPANVPGRVRVDVTLVVNGERRDVVPVTLE